LKTEPETAFSFLLNAVRSDDPKQSAVGIQLLQELPQGTDVSPLLNALPNLPARNRVQLITVLGERNQPPIKQMLVQALQSSDAEIRKAALKGLRYQRGEELVDLLSKFAAEHSGEERLLARESLARLKGESTDQKIITLIPAANSKQKTELIKAAQNRQITKAAPVVLEQLSDSDPSARKAAIRALKVIGNDRQLTVLIEQFSKPVSQTEALELSKTIAALFQRSQQKDRFAGMIADQNSKIASDQSREIYLELLGKLGHSELFPILTRALKQKNEDIKAAAIRGLGEWRDARPLSLLEEIIKTTESTRLRVLALRGYLRLTSIDPSFSSSDRLKHFQSALKYSGTNDEKKAVLSALSQIPSMEAFEICSRFLDDRGLKKEAAAAVVKIASQITLEQGDVVLPVLESIRAQTSDSALKKQSLELIKKLTRFSNYITDWMMAGPFSAEGKDLFDYVFPPEKNSENIEWKPVAKNSDPENYWHINLAKLIGGNNRVVYLRTLVWSPAEQKAVIEAGSDDYIKIWLNGRLVHQKRVARGISPGEDKAPVTLQKGWNDLLVKVVNEAGGWGACLRFVRQDGLLLEGLKIKRE